jgi:hypothetical protein
MIPDGAAVAAIHHAGDGAMWFGTNNGLVRYANGAGQTYTTEDALAGDDVRVIIEDGQHGCGSARTAACRSSNAVNSRAGPNATACPATASARCISIATAFCGSERTMAASADFRTDG